MPSLAISGNSPFTRLWTAIGIASIGDQLFLVTLPWLVLEVTGSGLALGGVLMLAALPRAGLMLLGGAVSDRYDPRLVIVVVYGVRACLLAAIAGFVVAGMAQPWLLYPFAVAFGSADAFAQPAFAGLMPRLVGPAALSGANSRILATAQAIAVTTSIPAGAMISEWGMGPPLAIAALSSALAGVPLWGAGASWRSRTERVHGEPPVAGAPDAPTPGGVMPVLSAAWRDPGLRGFLIMVAALSFATMGPLAVGIPAMAQQRFGSSIGLGVLMSASALGGLGGTLLAGRFERVRGRGWKLLAVNLMVAGCLFVLGGATTLPVAVMVVAPMAFASGFVGVVANASVQAVVARAVVGRVMSLVMLASVGLAPFSLLLAGAVLDTRPSLLFPSAAGLVLLVTLYAATNRALRTID